MPAVNQAATVGDLKEMLDAMPDDLPVRIASYDGDSGFGVYSVRKHVVTDEEDQVTDAYVVVNG